MTTPTSFAPARPSRGRLATFASSTIGQKIAMAVSGLIMAGFLVVHMTANLLAFTGPEHINGYARFLRSVPELLWLVRGVLLVSVIVHVISAVRLTRAAAAARHVDYERYDPQIATVASRTIRWFSILLAIFIVIHLLHFTTGTLLPGFVHLDPYANLVLAFRTQRLMAAFYIVMMIVVGLHLYHGTWSAIRTLGLSRPRPNPFSRPVATTLAVALWLGFTAVPVAVLLGWIGPDSTGVGSR
ncbi:MAG TPA: succinate dehydrogenase cytochrome b subunit [Gemmatimonadaceae bacterium]